MNISELDFSQIKENLKDFLKGQNEFKDYNFDGSNMSVLLDILSYNTHYLSFHANMLANEMFLDSASIRQSVVSHAKTLGYVPKSSTAPVAIIDIQVNDILGLSSAVIPKGTQFSSIIDEEEYKFITNEEYASNVIDGVLLFRDVKLYEGTKVSRRILVNTDDPLQRFLIDSPDVDIETITVTIQESQENTASRVYNYINNVTNIDGNSEIYSLQEVENFKYEVYFGDDVFGKSLNDGNIVILDYIVTNKSKANGAFSFTLLDPIEGKTDVSIITTQTALNGSERETVESIKFNAPINYSAQSRAVTSNDYIAIVKQIYPNIRTLNVWGGEDNDPPIFGKVFIAIKPIVGELSLSEKLFIADKIKQFNVASIVAEIVDIESIYIHPTVEFTYDSKKTNLSALDIESLISENIKKFNQDTLIQFNSKFRYSQLLEIINNTEPSILSNDISIEISKDIVPLYENDIKYEFTYNNELYHPYDGYNKADGGVIRTTSFKIKDNDNDLYIDDDGNGNLRLYYLVGGSVRTYINESFGFIDYPTGLVSITNVNIVEAPNDTIKIYAVPENNDVTPVRNQLLEIDTDSTQITSTVENS